MPGRDCARYGPYPTGRLSFLTVVVPSAVSTVLDSPTCNTSCSGPSRLLTLLPGDHVRALARPTIAPVCGYSMLKIAAQAIATPVQRGLLPPEAREAGVPLLLPRTTTASFLHR